MGNKSKRYFFVDLENVHRDGLKGVDKLTESDHVRIYYSNPLETVPMFLHRQIVESPAQFDYVTVEMPIKNAADCMILLDINTMAKSKKKKDAIFTIISKDTDFDRPIAEMKAKGVNVRKISVLCDDTPRPKTPESDENPTKPVSKSKKETKAAEKQVKEKQVKKETAKEKSDNKTEKKSDKCNLDPLSDRETVKTFLTELLNDFDISDDSDNILEQTVQAIMNAKTKTQVNTNLLQIFDGASVKLIYGKLKPLIKDLPGK